MSTTNQYYCIFLSNTQKNVTSLKLNVQTHSGCTCHGHCYVHSAASNGLNNIQEECTGHRLTTVSTRGNVFPYIVKNKPILSQQYNTLKNIIDVEINNRKKSNLYKKDIEDNKESLKIDPVSKNTIVKVELLELLNSVLSKSFLYKDIKNTPIPFIVDYEYANNVDITDTINNIKQLVHDCICYSDCNGYAACTCYGNCNHY